MSVRYSVAALREFATSLLARTGLEPEKATAVATILLEGDLLGHTTHGLALLAGYLGALDQNTMAKSGGPATLADFPAAVTWDGRRLPGPWLVLRALELAAERARHNGTCAVAIRRSHHIGCLAAYLPRFAEQGFMVLLSCCDPSISSVAPHGGRRDVFTPNPLAAAWPTAGDPVVLDVSMSITTNGFLNRLRAEGKKFPAAWAVDAQGQPTDNPNALFTNPPGALLPIGGVDHGHKGYALGLLVETLTAGLAGHGRADPKEGWGASVFVQVFRPECFGGEKDFRRQTEHVAALCRATPPRVGFDRVRLPGETGLRRRETQLAQGVELYPSILPALAPWTQKLGVTAPRPLA
ncbi:MAG TPA: Ldh family oxidoreductase [Opitutaceae bacterium]|nr:Ldh family oxidoreductase [Opitutaceae bacterium]